MAWKRMMVLALTGLFTLVCLTQSPLYADEQGKQGDQVTIIVLGDSLGDGLWVGLSRVLGKEKKFKILRRSKVGSGLAYFNMEIWYKQLANLKKQYQPKIAVVIYGGNDRIPMLHEGARRLAFKTEEWRKAYGERVSAYMTSLVQNDIRAFWVGLPAMRQDDFDLDMQYLNEIYKACAQETGVTFIPTRQLTVDDKGEYAAYGHDVTGQKRLLRANDGRHFTGAGYELLANHLVESINGALAPFEVASDRRR